MFKILKRTAHILNVEVEEDALYEIARRSRGTPRIANRILKRARDFAEIIGDGKINHNIAKKALNKLGIDDYGLDGMDNKLDELQEMIYELK